MGWGVGGRMWWAGKYERGRPGRVVWGVVASGRVGWGGEWAGGCGGPGSMSGAGRAGSYGVWWPVGGSDGVASGVGRNSAVTYTHVLALHSRKSSPFSSAKAFASS